MIKTKSEKISVNDIFTKLWTGVLISGLLKGNNFRVLRSMFPEEFLQSLPLAYDKNYALANGLNFERSKERTQGGKLDKNRYTSQPRTKVYEHINRLNDEWYSEVALGLARMSNRRVICSMYESHSIDKGLGQHIDEWDAVILQIAGSKKWNITLGNDESEDLILSSGDVLFLPEGIEHYVETPEYSVHLVFAILKENLNTYSSSS